MFSALSKSKSVLNCAEIFDSVSRYAIAIGMLYFLLNKNVEHKWVTQQAMIVVMQF